MGDEWFMSLERIPDLERERPDTSSMLAWSSKSSVSINVEPKVKRETG